MAAASYRVDLSGRSLAVTLTAPETASPAPALVALHGASEGTRGYVLYRHLHRVLPPVGIAVLTFDRRGEGRSTGDRSRGRLNLQADDALALVAFLADDPRLDAGRIGLWGFSQGAWAAPLAASESAAVRFLVLIASTGVTPADQMRYASATQLRADGFDDRVVERATELRRRFEAYARDGADGEELQARLAEASAEPWWPLVYLPPGLLDGDERRDWVAEMEFEPERVFARTDVPTLLFYGADDEWTPVGPSIAAWRRARADAEVVLLEGLRHAPLRPEGGVSREYEAQLVRWLRSRMDADRHPADRT